MAQGPVLTEEMQRGGGQRSQTLPLTPGLRPLPSSRGLGARPEFGARVRLQ